MRKKRTKKQDSFVTDEVRPRKTNYVTPRTINQKLLIDSINANLITFAVGEAGTGKTHIAVACAVSHLLNKQVEKIVITRPVVEAGPSIGFLPGTFADKLEPYLIPVFDELKHIVSDTAFGIISKQVEICPLNFMRGRTFLNSFIVADECFTGDTLVSVPGKYKFCKLLNIINRISNGDTVYVSSYNFETKLIEAKKITNVFDNGIKEVINVHCQYKKNPIKTTANHPFAVYRNGEIKWVEASDLLVNDRLVRKVSSGSNNALFFPSAANDILLGWILGDGSLTQNRNKTLSYRLSKNHEMPQYNYMTFCRQVLLGRERTGLVSGYTGKPICGFISKSLVIDDVFVDSCYQDGKKFITQDIEKWFSLRTLALWLMDDGSRSTTQTIFNTHGFTYNEVAVLSKILLDKFGLSNKIINETKKDGRIYHIILLNKESTIKLAKMLHGYVSPDLSYKVISYEKFNEGLYDIAYDFEISSSQVTDIKHGICERVFNLEVEGNNNYFAGNILVHNCQNATPDQLRMLITRFGNGSKMVLTGDPSQSDLKNYVQGGFIEIADKLDGLNNLGVIRLDKSDIVRHPIIVDILDRLNQ